MREGGREKFMASIGNKNGRWGGALSDGQRSDLGAWVDGEVDY